MRVAFSEGGGVGFCFSPTKTNGTPTTRCRSQKGDDAGVALPTAYITAHPERDRLAVERIVPASVASAVRGGVACNYAAERPRRTVGEGTGMVALTRSQRKDCQ